MISNDDSRDSRFVEESFRDHLTRLEEECDCVIANRGSKKGVGPGMMTHSQ